MKLETFLNYIRRRAKSFTPPRQSDYEQKLDHELRFYNDCEVVHDLPPIFHYWSNKYLLPKHQPFGIDNPEQFYFKYVQEQCQQDKEKVVRIVSIGSGNCDLECRLAQHLSDLSISNFRIECLDINESMLKRGAKQAQEYGVSSKVLGTRADFNIWQPPTEGIYDVVIANQCLHHVINLEHLFDAIHAGLADTGCFLTSDMIGRNGHQRWPEALEGLSPFWAELPEKYRFNRLMNRQEPEYINHDCSVSGFEGIRAQDILPLLVEKFDFELFVPFANIVLVFIDRAFGHNFDAEGEWDRDFIDRVHQRDEEAILSGEWKPTQMLAVLKRVPVAQTKLTHARLTPEFCIRHPE